MRHAGGRQQGGASDSGSSPQPSLEKRGSGGPARLDDYLGHMVDLLDELRVMAGSDPRMVVLERLLKHALDEAEHVSRQHGTRRSRL